MSTRESTAAPPGAAPARPHASSRRQRRPRNADPQASTRVAILQSAAALFRRLGYHGATVEQIAAALHMKKGNLYYYFKNKEAILCACHQYSLDRLLETLAEVEQSDAAPDEKLRQLIVSFVHTILDELHGTALFLDLEALSPAHLKAVIVRRDRFDRGMRQIVDQGIADGMFADADAKLLSFAILGAVNWIPRWYHPAGPATSQEIAERFAEYLIAGLRPNNAQSQGSRLTLSVEP
ncbi:MAG: TetR/AcrR family transcriptional regulator [Acidobacteria bacterium]|nr:TetR/AcrR family transcriptional regulator [Acidobacteriota bacterium]